MGISKDAVKAARAIAAVPTKARMTADVARASGSVQNLTRHFRDNLFERKLTVLSARRAIRSGDHSISTRFRNLHGKRPKRYICEGRLEVGDRLLRDFGLPVPVVAKAVGYDRTRTFSEHFEAFFGEDPEDVRGKDTVPEVDVATYRRVIWGEGDAHEVARVRARLDLMYDGDGDPPPPMVDGPGRERWQAADLWKDIRDMPFEEQRAKVRWHMWNTPALFDLLRRKSRQEGRKDRQVGIRLAELALISLGRCTDWWTGRIHDLRALGLAELANARRLALDFSGAEAELVVSWAEWRTPRESPDPLVEAEICDLHASLRLFQHRFDEASAFEDRALAVCKPKANPSLAGKFMLQKCTISYYAGAAPESIIPRLSEAEQLIGQSDPYLELACCSNLAKLHTLTGNYEAGADKLAKASMLNGKVGNRIIKHQHQMINGLIQRGLGRLEHAATEFAESRSGFAAVNEADYFAMASIELAISQLGQGRVENALKTVSEILPILQSLGFYSEAVAAEGLVRDSIKANSLSLPVLQQVKSHLRKIQMDPALRVRLATRNEDRALPGPR